MISLNENFVKEISERRTKSKWRIKDIKTEENAEQKSAFVSIGELDHLVNIIRIQIQTPHSWFKKITARNDSKDEIIVTFIDDRQIHTCHAYDNKEISDKNTFEIWFSFSLFLSICFRIGCVCVCIVCDNRNIFCVTILNSAPIPALAQCVFFYCAINDITAYFFPDGIGCAKFESDIRFFLKKVAFVFSIVHFRLQNYGFRTFLQRNYLNPILRITCSEIIDMSTAKLFESDNFVRITPPIFLTWKQHLSKIWLQIRIWRTKMMSLMAQYTTHHANRHWYNKKYSRKHWLNFYAWNNIVNTETKKYIRACAVWFWFMEHDASGWPNISTEFSALYLLVLFCFVFVLNQTQQQLINLWYIHPHHMTAIILMLALARMWVDVWFEWYAMFVMFINTSKEIYPNRVTRSNTWNDRCMRKNLAVPMFFKWSNNSTTTTAGGGCDGDDDSGSKTKTTEVTYL